MPVSPSYSLCICGNVYKCLNLCPCWKTWFAVYSRSLKEIRAISSDASWGTDADSIRFLNTDHNNKSWLDWVGIGLAHLNAICLTHSWPACFVQPLNLNQSLSAIKWNNGGVERALRLGLGARLALNDNTTDQNKVVRSRRAAYALSALCRRCDAFWEPWCIAWNGITLTKRTNTFSSLCLILSSGFHMLISVGWKHG